ncbi:CocE/NonD family hydrolase [Embleya scabrispora]|uniref:CocE/NonD family hydrolase n=1 Tax=Embleya scabrispora TaxID=159449 RepID=UPI000379114D|nr:CocE/NonD family hydrolase [Embleya scabrispora]MYS84841.1 CocE/NonD family hydrolase [Streptomyces sp. SID5474]
MTTTTTPSAAARKPPRRVRLTRRTLRGMPAPRYPVAYEPALRVPAADGSALVADHYQPVGPGDFPTLLMRSPYGRGFPWASMYGLAFAEQGFHVVLQSCRGTGGSGGTFALWHNEAADGQATVAWLREQPWFTGVLGTIGPSYLGYTQWALALDPPAELRAMVLHSGLHDPHAFFHSGGVFHLENSLATTAALLHQHRGAWRFMKAIARLQRTQRRVARTLPLPDACALALGERVPFLRDALAHPDADDPHWVGADVGRAADTLSVPTLLVSGWHDVLLDQALRQYERLRRSGCETALLVGPWTHNSMLQQGWPRVFADSLAWLRTHLCDEPSVPPEPPVRVHVGGADDWRDLPDWPPAETAGQRWYIGADGTLSRAPAAASAPVTLCWDPADPTPSVGGSTLSPKAGPRDNTALEARDDVLAFTAAPLTEPLEVCGPVFADVLAATGTDHVDVFARLCDVDERGRSTNVCDGILRLPPAGSTPTRVTVAMGATAHRFLPGHRIRLQLSGGAHPRFARNTGSGEPADTAQRFARTTVDLHPDSALVLFAAGR